MTWDARDQVIVMYGGYEVAAFGTVNDTWTYRVGIWNLVHTSATGTPSAREDSGIVFDPVLKRPVLFGGDTLYIGGSLLGDLWEFTGNNWTQIHLLPAPPKRTEMTLAWDPADGYGLTFGGNLNLAAARSSDSWSFGPNLTASLSASPSTAPLGTPVKFVATAADNASAVTWVGYAYSSLPSGCTTANTSTLSCTPTVAGTYTVGLTVNDRWGSVNGGNTTVLVNLVSLVRALTLTPSTIYLHQSFTLNTTTNGGVAPFTYTYSGLPAGCTSQNRPSFNCTPTGMGLPKGWTVKAFQITVNASDSSGRKGSSTATLTLKQIPHWSRLATRSGAPNARDRFGLVFDVADNYVVLFGGYNGTSTPLAFNDTWVYLSGSWIQVVPAVSPAPRFGVSMVYDAALHGVLLFGGENATGTTYYGDTWLFSAGNWTHLHPSSSPHARGEGALVYDPRAGVAVLFGGFDGHDLGDTWTFNGLTWTPTPTPLRLAGRQAATFVYDGVDNYSVLFGGINHTSGGLSDTWMFQNGSWSKLSPKIHPSPEEFGSATELQNGTILLYGGSSDTTHLSVGATWEFRHGQWYRVVFGSSPSPPRQGAGVVFDARDGYVLLFGGSSTPKSLVTTWLHDTWRLTGLPP